MRWTTRCADCQTGVYHRDRPAIAGGDDGAEDGVGARGEAGATVGGVEEEAGGVGARVGETHQKSKKSPLNGDIILLIRHFPQRLDSHFAALLQHLPIAFGVRR